ncbi:thioredoxin domain-containing protein [Bifidobacterium samirii]|uniref:DSBA oxidoreductase n=1 Tax=Bifidobacterium samirii TaxID=2306974 RepID=A0A430FV62_9BIFI|nr:thioredoxin domain-containing protein [Bifidobacterium samirii]RSX57444.1 DSBA oxidoreductase [Bifidobacterium samirii]
MAKGNRDKSRAARRAAEARAEQAAREQAERERRQQTVIGAIVVTLIVALLAVGGVMFWRSTHQAAQEAAEEVSVDDAYQAVQAVSGKPARADDKGGIMISKDGYGTTVDGAPTIAIYMDFMCPGCGSVNRQLDPTLVKLVDAGQINLELHFLSFMDRYSTDEYSSRAANAALYIADHDDDPAHLLDFIANMYADDFQPEEGSGYEPVGDAEIRQQAIDAGVADDVAQAAMTRDYDDWLAAVNAYTPKRPELFNTSGNFEGTFTTPALTINGTRWNLSEVSAAGMTVKDAFLESIGLPADKLGDGATLPSIGADGKPIDVMTGQSE